MRTIKSQDDKMIVNAEKVNRFCVDKIEEGYEKNFCLWRIFVIFDVWTKIAEYSTEKRALWVLEKLNEWLNQSTITTHQFESYAKAIEAAAKSGQYFQARFNVIESACFVMPQDSEELDA